MVNNYTTNDLFLYDDRQVDYLILNASDDAAIGRQSVSLDLFSGYAIAGIKKLAQRWVLEFLTAAGSMSKLRYRGTSFMIDALAGKFRSGLNVTHAFSEANMVIQRNLQQEEDASMPDDERFASATLEDFYTIPSTDVSAASGTSIIYLYLKVRVTSLAGTSAPALVPVPLIPKALR